MERLEFTKLNNITDHEFFANNYEAIMTVYSICRLFNDYCIKNLIVNNNIVYFELNKTDSIPIINSSSIYGNKYKIEMKYNNDNTIGIEMMVSG